MFNQMFAGVAKLTGLVLRRERIRIPIWLIALSFFTLIVPLAYLELYPTALERQAMAETMKNPAMVAMLGPGYGLENYNIGAMIGQQMPLFTGIAVAIMNILMVVRHTRADEEEGRIEMIRSFPVGRLSTLGATMIICMITNIVLALLLGFGLVSLGIEGMGLMGSLLYGATQGVIGIFFATLATLFAQMASSSRGAIGLSFGFLGVSYLVRAIGDVSSEIISLLSPLGWIVRTQVFVNDYWWPIFLTGGLSLIVLGIGVYLNYIRDLGAGFLPAKPGRKHASRFLKSPLGLFIRLQRTAIISWVIAMLLLGASYGSVLGELDVFFTDNEMMRQILGNVAGASLAEQFLGMLMSIMAMIATIPALMMVLKLRTEEKQNLIDHLLARAVSRTQLMASSLILAGIVGFLSLFLSVVGLWSAGTQVMVEPTTFGAMWQAAMVYLPAIWLMLGVAVFTTGYMPTMTGVTWIYLVYSFIVVYFGSLLQLPKWMIKLSPYGHMPQLPVEEVNLITLGILTFIGVGLVVFGFLGYRKRDIKG